MSYVDSETSFQSVESYFVRMESNVERAHKIHKCTKMVFEDTLSNNRKTRSYCYSTIPAIRGCGVPYWCITPYESNRVQTRSCGGQVCNARPQAQNNVLHIDQSVQKHHSGTSFPHVIGSNVNMIPCVICFMNDFEKRKLKDN